MAGHPIGEKAPIGNTDCPIGYGLYPLASFATSKDVLALHKKTNKKSENLKPGKVG